MSSHTPTNAKVRFFGTRDCEPRIEAKGEQTRGHSRTSGAKFGNEAKSPEKTAREPSDGLRDASHSLGTPASKGWRGFGGKWRSRERARRRSHRKVHHLTKPGSPNQRILTRGASQNPRRALQVHAKGERFRDLLSGARKTGRNFTSEKAGALQARAPSTTGFRLRSESARDSCPQASRANGHGRSTSRRFSGCGTWLPKPFCVPLYVCS
ncbi:hypothetical protein LMG28690_05416 [Paraburkholderia caffeinilytica]|nr:hypothetical protein LMG28690_05416 [Paraburkholderia caffeinilytica]